MLFLIGISTIIVGEVFFPANLYEVNPCVDSLPLEENGKDPDKEGSSKKENEGFTPLLSFILFSLFLSGIGKLEALGYIPTSQETLHFIFSEQDWAKYASDFYSYLCNNFLPSTTMPDAKFYALNNDFKTLYLGPDENERRTRAGVRKVFELLYQYVSHTYLDYRPFDIANFRQDSIPYLVNENNGWVGRIYNLTDLPSNAVSQETAIKVLHNFLSHIVNSNDPILIGSSKAIFYNLQFDGVLNSSSNGVIAMRVLKTLILWAIPYWAVKGFMPPIIIDLINIPAFKEIHPLYYDYTYYTEIFDKI